MIYIQLDTLPPSENNAYFNLPKGGRKLTRAAEKYKAETVAHIIKHHATQTKELKKDAAIGAVICFGFDKFIVDSWPKKAKHRFVRNDVLNRPKLLLDAIVEATAIDDSQLCIGTIQKYPSESPETRIYIWNEDEDNVGARLLGAFAAIIGSGGQVQSHGAVSAL